MNELNKAIRIQALVRDVAVLGETIVDGNIALKFIILNPCLKMPDFESLLIKIATLADELAK